MPADNEKDKYIVDIRTMTFQDCRAVSEIEKTCFSDAWSQSMFEDLLQYPTNYYLVAEMHGKIIGFAGSCISIDTADIMKIAVTEAFRGRGVGGKLLSVLLKKAETSDCEKILLEVRKSNQAARRLYQSFGFTELTVRKRYYNHPAEDAVVMCRII